MPNLSPETVTPTVVALLLVLMVVVGALRLSRNEEFLAHLPRLHARTRLRRGMRALRLRAPVLTATLSQSRARMTRTAFSALQRLVKVSTLPTIRSVEVRVMRMLIDVRIAIVVSMIALIAIVGTVIAAQSGGDEDGERAAATSETTGAAAASPSEPAGADDGDQSAVGEATATVLGSRYIGNSGGSRVSLRSDCEDSARVDGSWPEGAAVVLLEPGEGRCEGWTMVAGAGGSSWVREQYLVEEQPATVAASGGSAPAGTAPKPVATAKPVASSAPASTAPKPRPPLSFVSAATGEMLTGEDLNMKAVLRGGEIGFLYMGLISSSITHTKSICNPLGTYGSGSSDYSIRNALGQYGETTGGSPYDEFFNSEFSAYNASATQPRKIVINDVMVGWLTKNPNRQPANAVDPDALFAYLGC